MANVLTTKGSGVTGVTLGWPAPKEGWLHTGFRIEYSFAADGHWDQPWWEKTLRVLLPPPSLPQWLLSL